MPGLHVAFANGQKSLAENATVILKYVLESPAVAGAAGGLAWFLCNVQLGRIRNDKHVRKAVLEVVGGMMTGLFLSFSLGHLPQRIVAFVMGLCWSEVAQRIRAKVTTIVVAALSNQARSGN